MHKYIHKVQYYETDRMQVVHHSNHIRWFEEARIDYLDAVGISYVELERRGIICPVLHVESNYHAMLHFGETAEISVWLQSVTRSRYTLRYVVRDRADGRICAAGETAHCFLNAEGVPVSLKRVDPALYEIMCAAASPQELP